MLPSRVLGIPASAAVLRWLAMDFLRGRAISPAAWTAGFIADLCLPCPHTSFRLLMASHRFRPTRGKGEKISAVLERNPGIFDGMISDDLSSDQAAGRTLMLGMPRLRGDCLIPGVILIKFTETFRYFFHHIDVDRLQDFFCIVLEPSWSGYAIPEILFWTRAKRPIIVQATERLDREFLSRMQSNLVPVPFGASDWVDHRVFTPMNLPKEYDAVYVANYAPLKRIHVFLRALRYLKKRKTRIRAALICASWGGNRKTVQELLEYYGMAGDVDLKEDLNQRELNAILNKSKCNMLLSRKEGSNKSLFESMFAGTPVLLLEENIGVNKDYINSRTGLLVREKDLPFGILKMSREWHRFSPREWAIKHISPEATTATLSGILDTHFPDFRGAFGSLRVKVNVPEARYMDDPRGNSFVQTSRAILRIFEKRIQTPGDTRAVLKLIAEA